MLREPIGSLLDFASNDLRSVSIVGNMYINRRVGLAFARPPGWLFEDATSLLERAEGRILDPNDEIVTRVIRDLTEEYLPVVTIAAPPLEEGIDRINDVEFRPVVAVHHEPNCEPNLPGGFSLPRHVDIDLARAASRPHPSAGAHDLHRTIPHPLRGPDVRLPGSRQPTRLRLR